MTSAAPDPGTPAPVAPSGTVRASRALALAFTTSLICLCLGWELWWAPTGTGTLAVKVLPLLWPLVGLWRYRLKTYRSLSLLVWLYFTEGMVRSTSEPGLSRTLACGEVALSLLVFTACAWHVRARLARGRP